MSRLNINSPEWNLPLTLLTKNKPSATIKSLNEVGLNTLYDLLWIVPLRVELLPEACAFSMATPDHYFQGEGEILSIRVSKNYHHKGKKQTSLQNINILVKDLNSSKMLELKWFNTYPSVVKKLESLKSIRFMGKISLYNNSLQVINPEVLELKEKFNTEELQVVYPTINKIKPSLLKKLMDKIPMRMWNEIPDYLSNEELLARGFLCLSESFKILHGKIKSKNQYDLAQKRIIYEEFFQEQLKVYLRKQKVIVKKCTPWALSDHHKKILIASFPYDLTSDQLRAFDDIMKDLASGHPMMRLIQGDVGCGKTTVAILASVIAFLNSKQSALMSPTEALALQHFNTLNQYLENSPLDIQVSLLLGSTSQKEKKEILHKLYSGDIHIVVGTHSLFQDSVLFKDLGLAIIDEQHKFGVEQRNKLVGKGPLVHTLIMTATPIPRSLCLTQYGDLDISVIKSLPSGRKGHKTRIVLPHNYEKFLSFIKTRISLGEQAYVVTPAIEDNPEMDMVALEEVFKKFKQLFSNIEINILHGKLSSEEKKVAINDFEKGKTQILISTSVVEVGIDVPNATIMAIMSPERFGLSSLHQLRGRVGRGHLPGFCFLVCEKKISNESIYRLKIIENNTDGFLIAEEDLRIRGQGDLFGTSQSGLVTNKRLANIITNSDILNTAKNDSQVFIDELRPNITQMLANISRDKMIYSTI